MVKSNFKEVELRFFSNKAKKIAMAFMILLNLGIMAIGGFIYQTIYKPDIESFSMDGGIVFPEFKIDYSEIKSLIFYSICSCGLLPTVSVFTACCRTSLTSFLFIILAFFSASLCYFTSNECVHWQTLITD